MQHLLIDPDQEVSASQVPSVPKRGPRSQPAAAKERPFRPNGLKYKAVGRVPRTNGQTLSRIKNGHRNREIFAAFEAGEKIDRIASKYCLSPFTVRTVVRSEKHRRAVSPEPIYRMLREGEEITDKEY